MAKQYLTDDELPLQQRMFEELRQRIKQDQRQSEALPTEPKPLLRALGVTPWSDVPGYTLPDHLTHITELVLSNNPPNRFTVVESGNGLGKSLTAAAVVCAWLAQGEPAAAVTLAPTHSQVNNVLWRYIRQMHQQAKGDLPGTVYETPRWDIKPTWYAVGLSPRRATQEDLQALYGYHNPRLLVVLDEGPGLPRMLWQAIMRLVTAPGNRVLALGNPIQQAGPFWDACSSPNWNYVHMSCLDHPNVVLEKEAIPGATGVGWVRERIKDHCQPAAPHDEGAFEFEGKWWQPDGVFQSMVLGQAPTEATDQLISLSWVSAAMEWIADPDESETTVLSLDPSRVAHGDAAALICRKGPLVKWVRRRQMRSNNPTDEAAGWLLSFYRLEGAGRVFIEETGIGAGVVDRARSLGMPVIAVSPGSGASKGRSFANKRAECWWRLREHLQHGSITLPQDDMLAGDLTTPKFRHDATGRIILESKETIRERLGRSPDAGDALANSFALPPRAGLGSLGESARELAGEGRWVNHTVSPASKRIETPGRGKSKTAGLSGGSRWFVGSGRKKRFGK